jgi:hypothetical protein
MYLKPVTGRSVPDPDRGDFLPVEGREVVDQQYWLRRLDDGDVSEFVPGTVSAPKTNEV